MRIGEARYVLAHEDQYDPATIASAAELVEAADAAEAARAAEAVDDEEAAA